tara:strand:+ start:81 stop:299 length:219 start_codon:yes stop_codon:yes gene_type:complete
LLVAEVAVAQTGVTMRHLVLELGEQVEYLLLVILSLPQVLIQWWSEMGGMVVQETQQLQQMGHKVETLHLII